MKRQLIIDQPLDLDAVLDGTQDYRWRKLADGWRSGVLGENLIHIRQNDRGVEYRAHTDLDALLICYFRLDDDTDAIYAGISSCDDRVAGLVKENPYLRILRQPDPWECMVAYICSSNNSVKRISNIIEAIAVKLGKPVELDGEARHTFPTPGMVLQAGVGPLEKLHLGLDRHRKIVDAARRILDGKLDLRRLAQPQVPHAEAKGQLMECHGIGAKIADCIALFALDKMAAFPMKPVELDGEARHTFPTPGMVLQAGVGPLEKLHLGLDRHSRIFAAARRILDGELDLRRLAQPQVPHAEAKGRLMECHGIGAKIADCIALFALDKMAAFPIDVHVRRAVAGYFPNQKRPSDKAIVKWAQDRFGEYAGYANQFLFRWQFYAKQQMPQSHLR